MRAVWPHYPCHHCFFSHYRGADPSRKLPQKHLELLVLSLFLCNLQLLHPNKECILPYQSNNGELTNRHPAMLVQFQNGYQREIITLKNTVQGHPSLVVYYRIGKFLVCLWLQHYNRVMQLVSTLQREAQGSSMTFHGSKEALTKDSSCREIPTKDAGCLLRGQCLMITTVSFIHN